MLETRLYHIIREQEGERVIRLEEKHPIFQAHFPNQPILPGACMVEICREIISRAIGHELQEKRIKNVKFLIPVIPPKELAIRYEQIEELHYKISITNPINTEEVYANLSIEYMCAHSNL